MSAAASSSGGSVLAAGAGPDRDVPNGGVLDASATVVPGGHTATYEWMELGSSGVTFTNNSAATPMATTITTTFQPGQLARVVALRLRVTTSTSQDEDDVMITLYDPGAAFVDEGGTGTGASPSQAAGSIVTALENRTTQALVAVARGEYTVNSDPNGDGSAADAQVVVMVDGVVIRGGYAPGTFDSLDPTAGVTRVTDTQTTHTGSPRCRVVQVPANVTTGAALEHITVAPGGGERCDGIQLTGNARLYDVTVEAARSTFSVGIVSGPAAEMDRVTVLDHQAAISISGVGSGVRITNSVLVSNANGLHVVNIQNTGTTPIILTNNTLVISSGTSPGVRVTATNASFAPTQVELRNNAWVATSTSGFGTCVTEAFGGVNVSVLQNNSFMSCATILLDSQSGCQGNFACTDIADVNALPGASGNIYGDPMIADISARDFHLTTSSPAQVRGGGLNGAGQPWATPADRDGTSRTAPWSMGAYERD